MKSTQAQHPDNRADNVGEDISERDVTPNGVGSTNYVLVCRFWGGMKRALNTSEEI
jgi:hypothetical protein